MKEEVSLGECVAYAVDVGWPMMSVVLAWVGFVAILLVGFRILVSLFKGLYTTFLAHMMGFTVDWERQGRWAVITGGTDGIGKAYAEELARKGFDVVLISRSPEKLKQVAQNLESFYSVRTRTIAIDFTGGAEIYNVIRKELDDLEIGVLVNNVGISYDHAEYFNLIEDGLNVVQNIIKANVVATTMMMKLVLPQMEARRTGVVLNVASLSSLTPVPLLSVYAASKVYVDFLSRGLSGEYKDKGITIQTVLPGFVVTNMSKFRTSTWRIPTPRQYVHWALRTVGVETHTYGYPAHKLQAYFIEFATKYLPESLVIRMGFDQMNNIRSRYYKKYRLSDKNLASRNGETCVNHAKAAS